MKNPPFRDYLLQKDLFNKWIDGLDIRIEQLRRMGYVRAVSAEITFVRQATHVYADKQLKRVEATHGIQKQGFVAAPKQFR